VSDPATSVFGLHELLIYSIKYTISTIFKI
jgi:hypothetical protein